ncbi:PilZ domain-containing protein [Fredinandcohnia salidurans]|uniref:PilZ domain-containing protein n=1 Tax=Fredinandcohnia salidurans TaxID=2595041 RepID=A0ABW4MSM0_9BACI
MNYIVVFQSIIIIFLLFLFIKEQRRIVKQSKHIETLHSNNKKLKNELTIVKKTSPKEKRNTYRLNLPPIESIFTLKDFSNHSLGKLRDKNFTGEIVDISIGGLKFFSSYEFPVKYNIMLKISFNFFGEEFNLKGKIIRREDHVKGQATSYGVEFVDLTVRDITRLNIALHNYQAKNRHKIS